MMTSIPATGVILPASLTITGNRGATTGFSDDTGRMPAQVCRTVLVAIAGNAVRKTPAVSRNLLFSNSLVPGLVPVGSTQRDNPANDIHASILN